MPFSSKKLDAREPWQQVPPFIRRTPSAAVQESLWFGQTIFCLLLSLVTTLAVVKLFSSEQHLHKSNRNAMSSSSRILVYGGIFPIISIVMSSLFCNRVSFISMLLIGRGALGSAIIRHFKSKNYVSYAKVILSYGLLFKCVFFSFSGLDP